MGCHFAAVLTASIRTTASFKQLLRGFLRPSCPGVPAMSAYMSNPRVSLLLAVNAVFTAVPSPEPLVGLRCNARPAPPHLALPLRPAREAPLRPLKETEGMPAPRPPPCSLAASVARIRSKAGGCSHCPAAATIAAWYAAPPLRPRSPALRPQAGDRDRPPARQNATTGPAPHRAPVASVRLRQTLAICSRPRDRAAVSWMAKHRGSSGAAHDPSRGYSTDP
jgi:hypothetical protein